MRPFSTARKFQIETDNFGASGLATHPKPVNLLSRIVDRFVRDCLISTKQGTEMRTTGLILTAAAAWLAAAPANAVNIVQNGSFETGDFTGWQQTGDTSLSGVQAGNFGVVAPVEGNFQAFFGPTDPSGGGILQTLTTVARQSYSLTFSLANLGGPPNAFGLFWNGEFESIEFDQDPFGYTTFNVSLAATSSSTDLGFIFFNEPSFYLLDNISLEPGAIAAVPEPGTWAMLILGFGMVGGAMRYGRRSTKVAFATA